MRIILTLFATCLFYTQSSAQDTRKVDLVLLGSWSPMYSTIENEYYDFWSGPIGLTMQIFYNINDHWSAGIHGQATEYVGNTTDTYFVNAGASGRYIINPHSRFKFYGGIILGQTLVIEEADLYSNDSTAIALEQLLNYNENRFTVGAFLGLDIRIFNPISINIQVSHQDVFGAFAEDYVIHEIHNYEGFYNDDTNGLFLASGDATAYTYMPFYLSAGLTFKFGKKKL